MDSVPGMAARRSVRHQLVWMAQRGLIPLAVTVAFVAALLFNPAFDLRQLGQYLAGANYWWLVPATVIFFVGVYLRAARWALLLRPVKRLSPRQVFPVLIMGFMANNVLPFRIGEIVRAQTLHQREGVSRTASLATIVVERLFDGLALLALLGVVALVAPAADWLGYVLRVGGTLFLALFSGVAVVAFGGPRVEAVARRMVNRLPRRLARRLRGLVGLFFTGLSAIRRPTTFAAVSGLSFAAWLVESCVFWLALQAFSPSTPAYAALLVTSTANLAITLPSTQGGIGPFEFFAALSLMTFGVDAELAAAYALV
ncbi:MAG: flippase-like domain-containing protein, partial [Dehalococcoidia bacterium]|nr:flippase-like domain-containing protein [Dehalococcoidia bacterium]